MNTKQVALYARVSSEQQAEAKTIERSHRICQAPSKDPNIKRCESLHEDHMSPWHLSASAQVLRIASMGGGVAVAGAG